MEPAATETPTTPETLTYNVEVTDLWRESEGGWSANCAWVRRYSVTVPADATDATIARRIMKEAGIRGFRRDDWSGAEFSWRNGCIGAWAELAD